MGELLDFRMFVGRELNVSRRAIVPVIEDDHPPGAGSADRAENLAVFEARMRYYQAQRASLSDLAHSITAAEVLIETIHRLVAEATPAPLDLDRLARVLRKVIDDRRSRSPRS